MAPSDLVWRIFGNPFADVRTPGRSWPKTGTDPVLVASEQKKGHAFCMTL